MMLCELPPGPWREDCGLIRHGDAMIHHCNTIHRSEPNRSDHDRPGLLFVYKSIRCNIDESAGAYLSAEFEFIGTSICHFCVHRSTV